jgi:hypothetical protein
MAFYDAFIPPEIRSVPKLFEGDYSGALEAQLGRGGEYLRKEDQGKDEVRQGYADAIKSLNDLASQQKAFQMEGLNKAEGYYQPAQQQLESIYGKPGQMRK